MEANLIRFNILKAILQPVGYSYTDASESQVVNEAIETISVQDTYNILSFFLFGTKAYTPVILDYLQQQVRKLAPRKKNLTKIMAGILFCFNWLAII